MKFLDYDAARTELTRIEDRFRRDDTSGAGWLLELSELKMSYGYLVAFHSALLFRGGERKAYRQEDWEKYTALFVQIEDLEQEIRATPTVEHAR